MTERKSNGSAGDCRRLFLRLLWNTISTLITCAAAAVLIAHYAIPVLRITGSSMTPTLHEGELVVCSKYGDFECGDLVALYYGNTLLVKRCIAGPGDWVNIDAQGRVYVNDRLLDEPYVTEMAYGESDQAYPIQVPEGRYFVMGDHRSISMDSRLTQVGCIAREQIVGRIVLRVWPLKSFGKITGSSANSTGAEVKAAGGADLTSTEEAAGIDETPATKERR